jgi:hypothetical protein
MESFITFFAERIFGRYEELDNPNVVDEDQGVLGGVQANTLGYTTA